MFLLRSDFYRETWAEIQLEAIEQNLKSIREQIPKETSIMAVVKANGYGHGAVEVAETAINMGAEALGVAMLDEGIYLRNNGINCPILVLGYCPPKYADIAADYNISLTVYQKEWLLDAKDVLQNKDKVKLHIKCDTGMGRIGIQTVEELEEILNLISDYSCFELEGIFTHFAKADSIDNDYYYEQREKFLRFLDIVKEKPKWIHASNSAASLRFTDALFNLVRVGIVTYGLTPSPEVSDDLPIELHDAFSLHTKLIHIKKVKKGTSISYGCTYTAEEEEWIGTLPIGYADGWRRALQGQEVLIDGVRAPIVGRICMDQCMIKLPKYYPVGTKVTLIGQEGNEKISADEIAKKLDTINYEVVCMISRRIPRVYKKGDQIVKIINPLL